jgi:AbrB family looped-hinge helix DNA binding protein
MTTATLGDRYQLVIPRAERDRLGLRPRMKMMVSVEGQTIVIRPQAVHPLRGLGRDLADGAEATDYVRSLRSEWESRT